MKLDEMEAWVMEAPAIGPYAAAIDRRAVLALIACVRAADALLDLDNADDKTPQQHAYDAARAQLEQSP